MIILIFSLVIGSGLLWAQSEGPADFQPDPNSKVAELVLEESAETVDTSAAAESSPAEPEPGSKPESDTEPKSGSEAKLELEPEQIGSNMQQGLARKISLDLRGIDVVDTFKFLAMKGSLNIVTSKNVTGRITLFLKEVSIGDVLEVILLTNKLACLKENNIIMVMTEEEFEAIYGKKYVDKREVRTIKLKHALPSRVGAALETIRSSIGKIVMDDETGTIICIDTPEKIEKVVQTAQGLDRGLIEKEPRTVSKVFELEYAKVADIEEKVAAALTAGLGSVRSDERTNRLIVQDLPYKITEISEIIKAFDAKTREVVIEAKIVEITLNDDFAMGINWEKIFTSSTKDIQFLGNFPITYPSGLDNQHGQISIGTWASGFFTDALTEDQAYYEGSLDPRKTQQVLTFLKSLGKVKIVSSPRIAVCNNEEAQIMVGTRQPYATSTISQGDTTSTTSWAAEFVDIGITLTVTPTINKGGFVKMHIKPEVSTLTSWFEITDDSGTAQLRIPEVDTSNAETDVLVKDGRTIIIAGLIKETETKTERKIPILGDIPYIGAAFRSTYSGSETKELVVFLTPHIISGEQDHIFVNEGEKTRKPRKE